MSIGFNSSYYYFRFMARFFSSSSSNNRNINHWLINYNRQRFISRMPGSISMKMMKAMKLDGRNRNKVQCGQPVLSAANGLFGMKRSDLNS